jgi:NAD(P)-dependent dehydrogenase (short-subunit alcohol dehydrogenase family)
MTSPHETINAVCPAGGVAMPRDLGGSVALISGGGRGLGRLLARTLAAQGAAVALIARSGAGRGRIINITSRAGIYRWPLNSAYAISKAALVKLTETLAIETRRHGISVFSVDPGLLPIGLSANAIQHATPSNTAEARLFAWVRHRLASGEGADPARAADLVARLAAGCGDRLSGRHLTVHDDLDSLLAHIDEIEHRDLHTLRLRTAGETGPD